MRMFQILAGNCSTELGTCCSDAGLAVILSLVQTILNVIHVLVPIILIIFATIQLIQMMTNPDDKKNMKKLLNKFVAAIMIFLIPYIVNLAISILPDSFDISNCWEAAKQTGIGIRS